MDDPIARSHLAMDLCNLKPTLAVERPAERDIPLAMHTDYGRRMKPFSIEIPKFTPTERLTRVTI